MSETEQVLLWLMLICLSASQARTMLEIDNLRVRSLIPFGVAIVAIWQLFSVF